MVNKDKVLIVDDEWDAIEPLLKSMEHDGYEVHYAPDGAQGLEMVKQFDFNLILLDIMMPVMNGYEMIKHLQADEDTAYIPVIFVTGHFNADEIVKGLESGAVDAISKPFHISEVMMRGKVRIAEAKLKRRYTPIAHFFSEAQEKEHGRRTGVFEFYDRVTKLKVGDIYIEDGKVVYATSRDAIKEDAFLQLASSRDATYMFQEDVRTPSKTLSANITSLILEASKIIDELEAKEIRDASTKRVLVIDHDRIPRILASRALKAAGYGTMVTSADEITQETIEKYDADVLVVDYTDCGTILDRIKLSMKKKVPVIVYGDDDSVRELSGLHQVGSHPIDAVVAKTQIDQTLAHAVFEVLK
jgi:DNA-binding response OmpR family regulator